LNRQEWLYDEGDDATKAVYISKMDDIRFIAGPIVQRYMDKVEAERQAVQKAEDEKAAKKKEELEAKRKAAEEAKKAAEEAKKAAEEAKKAAEEAKKAAEPKKEQATEDEEMKDADVETLKPDGVEEPGEGEAKK